MAHKPEELQEVLQYTFKNPALLRIAMTHTSFANESKVATTHNERLEFLGDSVLSVVVADYLFHQSGRPEGELTRMRASLVSEEALFQFAGDPPRRVSAPRPWRGSRRRAQPPERCFRCV